MARTRELLSFTFHKSIKDGVMAADYDQTDLVIRITDDRDPEEVLVTQKNRTVDLTPQQINQIRNFVAALKAGL